MPSAIDAAAVTDLFADAAQIYVGVVLGGRPHVTPELLATGDGRLWCLSAAVTKKVEVLHEDARVGFLATTAAGDVTGIGRATVLDPLKPSTMTDPMEVARSAVGTARFVARNAGELTGAAFDTLAGKLGRPLPPHRVVISIEPTALAAMRNGEVHVWGEWSAANAAPTGEVPIDATLDEEAAPEALRDLLEDGPAALGWLASNGHPLVLPAAWLKASTSARVSSAVFVQSGAAERSPAAVTRDKWTGYGPTGKQGVMLRGDGVAAADGAAVNAALTVDRLTFWDGVDTHSTKTG